MQRAVRERTSQSLSAYVCWVTAETSKGPRRLHKLLLIQEPQRFTSQMCMLLSPGLAGVDRQQLITIVHREEGQREMPEQFPG